MRVTVTGSAGRVGGRLARKLLAEGHQVRGFDLRPAEIDHPGFEEVIGRFERPDKAGKAVDGADVVAHLGAFMSWLPEHRDRLFEANVDGTRIVLEAAAAAKVGRVLFASSGEVYPENVPVYQPLDEEHPCQPNSPYGLTKLLGEELVRFYGRITGRETVIMRFSHTQDAAELLDPDSFFSGPRFFLGPKIKQQAGFGNEEAVRRLEATGAAPGALVLSRNDQGRPFRMHITDTRDMVDGLMLGLFEKKAAGGTFNLGFTDPVDFDHALERMASATGLPLCTANLPGSGTFYRTSNQKVRETLGFAPVWSIDRMIDEAVETWRDRQP